jgi:predicted ATPase
MRIDRVIIRGLRALGDRDDLLGAPGEPWPAVCLRGVNGSGKTTYLEAIAQLWQWFARCQNRGGWLAPTRESELLSEADLLAIHLVEAPGPVPAFWVAWGQGGALTTFLEDHGAPTLARTKGKPTWDRDFLQWWRVQRERRAAGDEAQAPNIVWIEASNKWVRRLGAGELLEVDQKTPASLPVARYLPADRNRSHLEGVINTLHSRAGDRFLRLQRWVNVLLPGIRLEDHFSEAGRPTFKLANGTLLTVDRLSAGEQSVLINVAMVLRWLEPGGLLLLDEPELHQHLSLMRGSIAVLEAAVADLGGQLLAASHAPEVWDHFRARNALLDLGAPVGRGQAT